MDVLSLGVLLLDVLSSVVWLVDIFLKKNRCIFYRKELLSEDLLFYLEQCVGLFLKTQKAVSSNCIGFGGRYCGKGKIGCSMCKVYSSCFVKMSLRQ